MDTQTATRTVIEAQRDVERDQRVCFACGSERLTGIESIRDRHAATIKRYSLVVCRSCGSGRLRDALSTDELEALYPKTFYSYEVVGQRHPALRLLDKIRYDRHRFRPSFSNLLEVGSGCGEFLATIKNRGSVVGLERSEAARAGGKTLGVDVRVGNVVNSALFEPESFDYVYLSHSFEHIDDPAGALSSIHGWLTDGGRAFFAVPNFGGLLPRLLPRYWYNLALPLHVSQFTRNGIRALLESRGFIVDKIVCNSDPISLPMTAYFLRGTVHSSKAWQRRAIMAAALFCIPFSRLLDVLGIGDCIEVHARKRAATAPNAEN